MTKKHSILGASSASRWFACPGSVRLCQTVPPQADSIHSVQGSAAHAAIEDYYEKKEKGIEVDIYDYVGFEFTRGEFEYELTSDDVDAIAEYVRVVEDERAKGKYVFHSEAKFALDRIHPGLFGTADTVLMASNMKRLVVMDYKHGAGVPVEVNGNKQLKYYALGAIEYVCKKHKIDYLDMLGWGGVFKEVEIVVVQPRCRHKDGAVRRAVVSGEEMDAFAVELANKAKETEDPNAQLSPGDHCRWCPALAICPGFSQKTMEIAKADFTPAGPKFPAPESLTAKDLAKIMQYEPLISKWLESVSAHAQHLLEHGETVPGFKLVKKRATRKWTDEETAAATLEMVVPDPETLYEKSFISPAKVEKLLGKKAKGIVETLVTTPDTGTTIAPDHDPREQIAGSAVSDFS